jgi:hypothetical protein
MVVEVSGGKKKIDEEGKTRKKTVTAPTTRLVRSRPSITISFPHRSRKVVKDPQTFLGFPVMRHGARILIYIVVVRAHRWRPC